MSKKKIFIICTVRNAEKHYVDFLEDYAKKLESFGFDVHLPHRDTDQNARGIDICKQNAAAIFAADQVHISYNELSQGTHFDMGVAFALGKHVHAFGELKYGKGKSYARMLDEWEQSQRE